MNIATCVALVFISILLILCVSLKECLFAKKLYFLTNFQCVFKRYLKKVKDIPIGKDCTKTPWSGTGIHPSGVARPAKRGV